MPSFIYGTTPAWLNVREWGLAEGDMFTDRDVRNASKVCVLGQRLVRELFQGENPLGKEVRVKNVSFRVIGVLTGKGANMMGMDQDDVLLAPWTTIKFPRDRLFGGDRQPERGRHRLHDGEHAQPNLPQCAEPALSHTIGFQTANTPLPVRFINVDQILTAGRSAQEIPAAIKQITQILRERHRIGPGESDDFNIRDMTEMTKALSSTGTMMTKLLLAVALISLLVGGVGIMNIMLVSVTERTREIGLRLAVGAWSRDILQQFLAESVILCFFGGAVGILVGRGISMLVRVLLGWPTELSLGAIVAAFARFP